MNQGDSSDIPDHGGEVFVVPLEDDKGIVGEDIIGLRQEKPSTVGFSILVINKVVYEQQEQCNVPQLNLI